MTPRIHTKGFTLIEILVSILILGVMLLMLLGIVRANVLARMAKNQGIAVTIARSELEGLRAGGYATLPASGTFSGGLLGTLPVAMGTITVSDYNAKTKQVAVTVAWQEPNLTASSTISLTTLITQVGGLP